MSRCPQCASANLGRFPNMKFDSNYFTSHLRDDFSARFNTSGTADQPQHLPRASTSCCAPRRKRFPTYNCCDGIGDCRAIDDHITSSSAHFNQRETIHIPTRHNKDTTGFSTSGCSIPKTRLVVLNAWITRHGTCTSLGATPAELVGFQPQLVAWSLWILSTSGSTSYWLYVWAQTINGVPQ